MLIVVLKVLMVGFCIIIQLREQNLARRQHYLLGTEMVRD